MPDKMRVFAGLSGRVGSSAVAVLLPELGFDCAGMVMITSENTQQTRKGLKLWRRNWASSFIYWTLGLISTISLNILVMSTAGCGHSIPALFATELLSLANCGILPRIEVSRCCDGAL